MPPFCVPVPACTDVSNGYCINCGTDGQRFDCVTANLETLSVTSCMVGMLHLHTQPHFFSFSLAPGRLWFEPVPATLRKVYCLLCTCLCTTVQANGTQVALCSASGLTNLSPSEPSGIGCPTSFIQSNVQFFLSDSQPVLPDPGAGTQFCTGGQVTVGAFQAL